MTYHPEPLVSINFDFMSLQCVVREGVFRKRGYIWKKMYLRIIDRCEKIIVFFEIYLRFFKYGEFLFFTQSQRGLFLKDFHSDAQLSRSHINVSSVRLKRMKSKGGNGCK